MPTLCKINSRMAIFVSKNNTGIKTRSVERGEDPALVKKYNVTGFPTILLVDSQGKKLKHTRVHELQMDCLIFAKGIATNR